MWVIRFMQPGPHHQYGPFKTPDAAAKWASKEQIGSGWIIQKLTEPYKN